MNAPLQMTREDLQKAKSDHELQAKRQERRSDALYIAGAAVVTLGVGLMEWKWALIVGGAFLLLTPMLGLASSFIKGLRVVVRR